MHKFKDTCTDEAQIIINNSIVESTTRKYLALQLWILDNPYGSKGSIKEKDRDSLIDYFKSEAFAKLETVHDGAWFINELNKQASYIHMKKIEKEIYEEQKKRRKFKKRSWKLWKSTRLLL